MDKQLQIQFLIEYLVKSNQAPKNIQKVFEKILLLLEEYFFVERSIFEHKKLKEILKKRCSISIYGYESAKNNLYKIVQNNALKKEKDAIFKTLMASNFPQHKKLLEKSKEEFELALSKVEIQMYNMITLYIELFHLGLDLFFSFSENKTNEIEQITNFSIKIHEILIQNIFFEEEKTHVEEGLRKLCVIYIGLYCKDIKE